MIPSRKDLRNYCDLDFSFFQNTQQEIILVALEARKDAADTPQNVLRPSSRGAERDTHEWTETSQNRIAGMGGHRRMPFSSGGQHNCLTRQG